MTLRYQRWLPRAAAIAGATTLLVGLSQPVAAQPSFSNPQDDPQSAESVEEAGGALLGPAPESARVAAPSIEVTPGAVAAEVPAGSAGQTPLTISNQGDASLDWEIGEAAPGPERLALLEEGLLLVPDSSNDRVMAFDPQTGDLIDPNFIPYQPDAGLQTPIEVMLNPGGDGFWLSDQVADVIFGYDLEGNYLGVFAPAGGADRNIADNIRGIGISPDGDLLVTVASGANAHAVAEFDSAGNYTGNYIANGAGGLNGPWDLLFRDDDVLVTASSSGAVHRYGLDGTPLGVFHPGMGFPQQMQQLPNGNILIGQFTTLGGVTPGVWELTADGELVDIYTGVSSNRGVYDLPNGNILTTNSGGVHEIDRGSALVETKISGANSRFITHVQVIPSACDSPTDIPWLSVSPASGSTAAGSSSEVTVSFDTSGLTVGEYEALLCVQSNDPVTPVVEVPVELTVLESAPSMCDTTITGVHVGALHVTEGVTCLAAGAQVLGEVNVAAGAGLVATAAVVQGPVSALGASVLELGFTQVTGPVLASGGSGSVWLFGNQVTGSVTLVSNSTDGDIAVSGNTVIGSLTCFGSDPAPTNLGLPNTATAGAFGQCADL